MSKEGTPVEIQIKKPKGRTTSTGRIVGLIFSAAIVGSGVTQVVDAVLEDRDLNEQNVKSKKLATIDWIDKINELKPDERMNCTWSYVLLGENTFYGMSEKGAETEDILEYAKLSKAKIKGTLGDYVEDIKDY